MTDDGAVEGLGARGIAVLLGDAPEAVEVALGPVVEAAIVPVRGELAVGAFTPLKR